MSQPKRGRSSQAQNHLITILLALVIAGLSMWFGAGRDGGNTPDAAATPMPGSDLTVTYLDVGQGDCTLLQCDGQTMLIDAGIGEQANHITTYLKQQGVKSIDYLVCTHAHADHCGGMKAVIAAAAPPRAIACCMRRSQSTPSSAAALETNTATRTTTRSAVCATRT